MDRLRVAMGRPAKKVARRRLMPRLNPPRSYTFMAMNSPCEVLLDGGTERVMQMLGQLAGAEARRIEHTYSRYRSDSLLSAVNRSAGMPVAITPEMAALLDYADTCFRLSDGRFDITSGVLRRAWRFDETATMPSASAIGALLPLIGWEKIERGPATVTVPPGMELDFGGLGKEYAVDRVLLMLAEKTDVPVLVNFGGDLRVTGPRRDGSAWQIAIDAVDPGAESPAAIALKQGALTTSGDARRSIVIDGTRYGHILDPRSGWPVQNAPRSVTVAAPTCMEAGIMSTLAMAHGAAAEQFLRDEQQSAWVLR